jgi:C-methyltransferase
MKNISLLKNRLKNTFTQYWDFLTMRTACQLDIFDLIADGTTSARDLCQKTAADPLALSHLLAALQDLQLLKISKRQQIKCTKLGLLLTQKSPNSLKNACLLWAQEHLAAWANLAHTIRTGKPSFEQIYAQPFFDYLQTQPEKLQNYQLAMRDYARDDYRRIAKIADFAQHTHIIDVGGGTGELISRIAKACPKTHCTLFDLPQVVELSHNPPQNLHIEAGSFFEPLPTPADAIILARVLHDWDDDKANQILAVCHNALSSDSRLYVLEIMQEKVQAHALSLNMMLMCQSHERTSQQYKKLLKNNGFVIVEKKRLNALQMMLICKKKKLK